MSELEELVARADPDRYLAALFAPRERRAGLMALYAFDAEVARIAEVVHEPMVGHIRLAWWREQIATIHAGGAVEAPVARALAETVRNHALPKVLFERYLDARALDLDEAPFADEAAMERRAVAVSSGMMQLAVRVLGGGERADAAAKYAGIAVSYARTLNALAAHARRRHAALPVQWLHEAGLNAEDVFAGRMTPALRGVVGRVVAAARDALAELRRQRLAARAMPALAPAVVSRWTLARAGEPGFDPFTAAPTPPPWQRLARIAVAQLVRRV